MHEPRILGHSIHPAIVVFPLSLLSLAVVFDFIHLIGGGVSFAVVSYWMMTIGLIGGVTTALIGWVEWLSMPNRTGRKTLALAYGVVNAAVLLLYLGSWYTRTNHAGTPEVLATVFSTMGAGVGLIGSWLGGELFARTHAADADEIISLNVTTIDAHNVSARGAH